MATYVWDGGGDGISWNDPLNWDLDSNYPFYAGGADTATINHASLPSIRINADITIPATGVITQGATNASYITINNGVTVTNNAGTWTLSATNSTLTIDTGGKLILGATGGTANLNIDASTTSFTINSGGQLYVNGGNMNGTLSTNASNKSVTINGTGIGGTGAIIVISGNCDLMSRDTGGTTRINDGTTLYVYGGRLSCSAHATANYNRTALNIVIGAATIVKSGAGIFACHYHSIAANSTVNSIALTGTTITTSGTGTSGIFSYATNFTIISATTGNNITLTNCTITNGAGVTFYLNVNSTIGTCNKLLLSGTTVNNYGTAHFALLSSTSSDTTTTISGNSVINQYYGIMHLIYAGAYTSAFNLDTGSVVSVYGGTLNIDGAGAGVGPLVTINGEIKCVNPVYLTYVYVGNGGNSIYSRVVIGSTGRIYVTGVNAVLNINSTHPYAYFKLDNSGAAGTGVEVGAGATFIANYSQFWFGTNGTLTLLGSDANLVNRQPDWDSLQISNTRANTLGTLIKTSRGERSYIG